MVGAQKRTINSRRYKKQQRNKPTSLNAVSRKLVPESLLNKEENGVSENLYCSTICVGCSKHMDSNNIGVISPRYTNYYYYFGMCEDEMTKT